jgi:carboxymethylenebutenolidase
MARWLGASVLATLSASLLLAQQPASRPSPKAGTTTEKLVIDSKTYTLFMARPAGEGPFPGILLLHDCWGLTDGVKQQAERLSGKGYVVLAIDLYDGHIARNADEAHKLMQTIQKDQARDTPSIALQFLTSHKLCKGKKVAVVGWCLGADSALKTPTNAVHPAATVLCYGASPARVDDVLRLRSPILAIWGGANTERDVAAFDKVVKNANKTDVEKLIYPKARHGFMNPADKRNYDAKAATKAWTDIDAFLDKHLQG